MKNKRQLYVSIGTYVFRFSFSKNMEMYVESIFFKTFSSVTNPEIVRRDTSLYVYIYREIRSTTQFIHLEGPREYKYII